MSALAELFLGMGAVVSGSDTEEVFYTDQILKELGIKYTEKFSASNITPDCSLVIHSSAYSKEANPDLMEAVRRKIPLLEYTQALGAYSSLTRSCGIAGVHGKTTTTGLTGTILREMGLRVSVLAGSAISNFDGKSTFSAGKEFFVAETCEYKRHFLSFSPEIIAVTGIEADHLDYFSGYEDIYSAFLEYAEKLPYGGTLVYCADDEGALRLSREVMRKRSDLVLLPYGERAEGFFRVTEISERPGITEFSLEGVDGMFELRVPGRHNVLNSAAAAAVSVCIASKIRHEGIGTMLEAEKKAVHDGIKNYRGSKRRSELLGEAAGIIFMDDYAHHPTAIKTTLSGLKSFYPGRRIIVDFMSHTYSRTKALLDDFASSFNDADLVILNRIYSSAREKEESAGNLDNLFFEKTREKHGNVVYYDEPADAAGFLEKELRKGDLFVTMGAGDNWKLGKRVFDYFRKEGGAV